MSEDSDGVGHGKFGMNIKPQMLTDEERATYEWQMWVEDFGEAGQERLKGASVLVSRCGGVGGVVAYELAAAGVGKLVIPHAGKTKHSDLNRQLLMTYGNIGKERGACLKERLLDLNPRLEVVSVDENVSEDNAEELVGMADVVVDCAPLFVERFAMNRAAMRQGKPMVECPMYDCEAQLTTFLPGKTGCLACLYPETPDYWKREFPVFGAVSGMVACMAAMEVIKLIGGFGKVLADRMLTIDLRGMGVSEVRLKRDPECEVCVGI